MTIILCETKRGCVWGGDYMTEEQLDQSWAGESSFTSIERILSENYLENLTLKMMANLWHSLA